MFLFVPHKKYRANVKENQKFVFYIVILPNKDNWLIEKQRTKCQIFASNEQKIAPRERF